MMKRKVLVLLLVVASLLFCGYAAAEEGPIVSGIEITPTSLTGPGEIEVSITVSNATDADMKDPVVLYDPNGQIVSDFGTNGAALLKAGENLSWKGSYDVNDNTLDTGMVVYYLRYKIYKESGEAVEETKTLRTAIERKSIEEGITIERTISHTTARQGQEVLITYNIKNTGTMEVTNVTIQEKKGIDSEKQTISSLAPGKVLTIKYPVKMKKKDITSAATITYEVDNRKKTYTEQAAIIEYADSKLIANLTASAKGVAFNEKVTLTLELKNTGSVDYSNIKVSDATIGNDLFPNEKIEKGKTIKLEKEITLTQSTDYQFNVTAIDSTGTEVTTSTGVVTVKAVDPADALALTVKVTADKTEVFESPGLVRFTIEVTNPSRVEATDAKVLHGETEIYTFKSIPAGETRKMTRDTALTMAGKYRFTVTAKDPIENVLTFQSNDVQIAFSVPTPAPATPTPPPNPTAEPTFNPETIAPITDPSIGAVPKAIRAVVFPVSIIAGVLLAGSCVLLIISTKRRADQKRASKNAYDHLERAKRRDYNAPAEEDEPEVEVVKADDPLDDLEGLIKHSPLKLEMDDAAEFELPHMKYARSVAEATKEFDEDDDYSTFGQGVYDEEMTSDMDVYNDMLDEGVLYDAPYDEQVEYDDPTADTAYVDDPLTGETDGYTDGYVDDGKYADEPIGAEDGYDPATYDQFDPMGSYDTTYDSSYDEVYEDEEDNEPDDNADGYDDGMSDCEDALQDDDAPDADPSSRAAGRRSRQRENQSLDL